MPTTALDERLSLELARCGLRATRQRIATLRALRSVKSHPTAHDVHKMVVRKQSNVSRKTIYEALAVLVEAGLASCVTDGGEPYRYDANNDPHYHARCRICDTLIDLPATSDPEIRRRTRLPKGFAVDHIQVTIYGTCPRCRA